MPDMFDFDDAPASPQTLPDDQPRPSGDAPGDSDFSRYGSDEVATLEEATRCRASFAAPKSWSKDGKGGERIRFTVSEPVSLAGFEATLFLTLQGAPDRVGKSKRDLAAFGKVLGCADKSISGILAAVKRAADDALEIDVELVPAKNGGDPFVNFVAERKTRK